MEIPILAKYTIIPKGKIQFFVEAGPSLAVGVGGKAKEDATMVRPGLPLKYSTEYSIKFGSDKITAYTYPIEKRTDIGLQAGFGAIFLKKVMLDVRYTYGMTKIIEMEDNSFKNQTFQITVGVPFTLK